MDVAALDLGCRAELRFWVEFVREDGTVRRVPLAVCAGERFEDAVPVRSFHWVKGAAHFPGLWWSSTMGAHVGFESWLERDHLLSGAETVKSHVRAGKDVGGMPLTGWL